MINPNKYRWKDTGQKLKQIVDERNIDRAKLEKASELAAYKIYPVYSAYNYEIGDKVASLHYLKQIIFELAVREISDVEDTHSWGGIVIESCRYGEDDTPEDWYAINISFHLDSLWFEDLQLNK